MGPSGKDGGEESGVIKRDPIMEVGKLGGHGVCAFGCNWETDVV